MVIFNVVNKVKDENNRQCSGASKTAKIHIRCLVTFVVYCFITKMSAGFY